jgi:hypothetical protein
MTTEREALQTEGHATTRDEARRIAHAAGWDAGNRSMREHGRTSWNEDDWAVACETHGRLLAELEAALFRAEAANHETT